MKVVNRIMGSRLMVALLTPLLNTYFKSRSGQLVLSMTVCPSTNDYNWWLNKNFHSILQNIFAHQYLQKYDIKKWKDSYLETVRDLIDESYCYAPYKSSGKKFVETLIKVYIKKNRLNDVNEFKKMGLVRAIIWTHPSTPVEQANSLIENIIDRYSDLVQAMASIDCQENDKIIASFS